MLIDTAPLRADRGGNSSSHVSIEAAVQKACRQLPSTIARLAFLSQFRDPNDGSYRHPATSNDEKAHVHRVLRVEHEKAFSTWLGYRLEEQQADLDLYFSSLECCRETVAETWLTLESYRSLVPASATPADRQLFFTDLQELLRLMIHEVRRCPQGTAWSSRRGALLTTKQVSQWLGVSCRTLRLWAESEQIPGVKIGRQWRFRRDDVEAWLNQREA